MKAPSVREAIEDFLDTVRLARSKNTYDTYKFAMRSFEDVLSTRALDMEGHIADDPVSRAVDELRMRAQFLKILGSYPRAI